MAEIQWGLLQPVDTGAQVQQGFATGMALVKRIQTQHALQGYLQNPDDPHAFAALAAYDPQTATSLQEIADKRHKTALELAAEQRRKDALTRYATGDKEGAKAALLTGGDFDALDHISKLDAAALKQEHDRYQAAAPFAYDALKMPDIAQRKQYINSIAPQLLASGWTQEQINGFEPTDAALGGIVRGAQTLAERMKQDEVQYREVGPGARLVPFDWRGNPITGDAGGAAPAAATPAVTPGSAPAAIGSTLSSGGLPAPVVAGFLGNFHVEGGYGGASGDGGTSHGILQLHSPDRIANFRSLIGKDPGEATPEETGRFVLWEMQNPQKAGMTVAQRDAILNAKDPGQAAALIDQYYERSSGVHRAKRVAAAHAIGGADPAAIKAHAQEAIAAGADPTAVRARAASMGVSL